MYIYILIVLLLFVLFIMGIQKDNENFENDKKKDNNKNYNICVLMWYNDEIKNYADKCYEINKKYCKKYGFDIIKSDKRFYKDRKPHYERFPLILENLKKYDYVIWIDADAHFYLDSPDISRLIEKYSKYNFILSGDLDDQNIKNQNIDRKNSSIINSGMMIIKNSEYSNNVVNHWLTSDELLIKRHGFNDQGIIRLYRADNINNFEKESIVLQYGIMQRFYRNKYDNYTQMFSYLLNYKPYVIHYAGEKNDKRLKQINEYYKSNIK